MGIQDKHNPWFWYKRVTGENREWCSWDAPDRGLTGRGSCFQLNYWQSERIRDYYRWQCRRDTGNFRPACGMGHTPTGYFGNRNVRTAILQILPGRCPVPVRQPQNPHGSLWRCTGRRGIRLVFHPEQWRFWENIQRCRKSIWWFYQNSHTESQRHPCLSESLWRPCNLCHRQQRDLG